MGKATDPQIDRAVLELGSETELQRNFPLSQLKFPPFKPSWHITNLCDIFYVLWGLNLSKVVSFDQESKVSACEL